MPSRDELNAELLRLYEELRAKQSVLGQPPPPERPRHPAYFPQQGQPYRDEASGEFRFTEEYDPYEEMKKAYAKRLQGVRDTEAKIAAIRREFDQTANLNATQLKALELIREEGPILGKTLAKKLGIEGDTLRKHVLPPLRTHGVKNDRNSRGYYLPKE